MDLVASTNNDTKKASEQPCEYSKESPVVTQHRRNERGKVMGENTFNPSPNYPHQGRNVNNRGRGRTSSYNDRGRYPNNRYPGRNHNDRDWRRDDHFHNHCNPSNYGNYGPSRYRGGNVYPNSRDYNHDSYYSRDRDNAYRPHSRDGDIRDYNANCGGYRGGRHQQHLEYDHYNDYHPDTNYRRRGDFNSGGREGNRFQAHIQREHGLNERFPSDNVEETSIVGKRHIEDEEELDQQCGKKHDAGNTKTQSPDDNNNNINVTKEFFKEIITNVVKTCKEESEKKRSAMLLLNQKKRIRRMLLA